jgi:hypothetical protein
LRGTSLVFIHGGPMKTPLVDPLPAKQGIITFMQKVTTEGSPDFVQPAERIASFASSARLQRNLKNGI